MVALTRPKYRVIASTKCEVKITKKYQTASTAIVSTRLRILIPVALNLFANNTIARKARKSDLHWVSTIQSRHKGILHTKSKGKARIRDLQAFVLNKHAQPVCVERYRWERCGYPSAITTKRIGTLSESDFDARALPYLPSPQ